MYKRRHIINTVEAKKIMIKNKENTNRGRAAGQTSEKQAKNRQLKWN